MKMEPVTNWLTGPRARKLLRLYLAWPNRFNADPETEGRQFFCWLKSNYGNLPVVESVRSVGDVALFLSCNPEVIEAAKFLKPNEGSADSEGRRERRVSTSTYVFAGVFDCPMEPHLIGTSVKGIAVDVTPGGLCIEVNEDIPAHSILNMTVAPAGYPIVLYRISAEVRWTRSETSHRYQLGTRILDCDEASRWRDEFDQRFIA